MNVNVDGAAMPMAKRTECQPSRPSADRAAGKHVIHPVPLTERDPPQSGRAGACEPLRWPPRVFPGL